MISKEQLKKLYIEERKTQKEVAEILEVKLSDVANAIHKYQLKKGKPQVENYNKPWTKEEEEYLMESFGIFSYKAIAKHLKRTVGGVKKKIKTLKLGDPRLSDEFITQNALSKILKIDDKTIQEWRTYHKLKMKKKNIANNYFVWKIKISDFWKWAEKHHNLINWNKFKHSALGVEPKWTMKIRLEYDKPKKNYIEWTKSEEALMISYYKAGISTKKIAENLGRTQGAIKTRLCNLGYKKVTPKSWTTGEIAKLKDLVKQGLTAKEISKSMDRTVRSVERAKSVYITKLENAA